MTTAYSGDGITFPDSTVQATAPKVGMVNRIINGDMRVSQRDGGAAISTEGTSYFNGAAYTLDRWNAIHAQTAKFSVQQNAGSVTPPVGFSNYLGATSTSAYTVVAGDYFGFGQRIEGFNTADLNWGTANAATVTLYFWVRSSLTGTFGGAVSNSANNRSYAFNYTISSANTWEKKTITIAGDTSGTWIGATNGTGIQLTLPIAIGTTYAGTAGSWDSALYIGATGTTSVVGTSGATFYVTGVQLEKGSTATDFEYVDYSRQLQMCQRYYESSYDIGTPVGTITSNGVIVFKGVGDNSGTTGGSFSFKVTKRALSTMTFYSATTGVTANWTYSSSGIPAGGAIAASVNFVGFNNASVSCGSVSGWMAAVSYGHYVASAEL